MAEIGGRIHWTHIERPLRYEGLVKEEFKLVVIKAKQLYLVEFGNI